MPTCCRIVVVMCCWLENPHAIATSAIGIALSRNMRMVASMRWRKMKRCGVQPVEARKHSAKRPTDMPVSACQVGHADRLAEIRADIVAHPRQRHRPQCGNAPGRRARQLGDDQVCEPQRGVVGRGTALHDRQLQRVDPRFDPAHVRVEQRTVPA